MSLEASGGSRRQLVVGTYGSPVWSPDGSRFAAYGATTPGGLSDQLAIFDGEGHALARYAIDGIGVDLPVWSPDGRFLLCLLRDPSETSGTRSAWVLADGDLHRLDLPGNATPWRWTPDNRLAYLIYPFGGQARVSQSNPLTVWSVDPVSDQPRQEARGVIAPLGWSPNGQTFYAFDGLLPDQGTGTTRATNVVAIDRRTGSTRTLISATNAANAPWQGTPTINNGNGTTYWFEGGSVSPAGGELALLAYTTGPTTSQMIVTLVDENGQIRARDLTRPSYPTFAWSPGGIFTAFIIPAGNSGGELHILAPNGQPPYIYPVTAAWVPGTYAPSWSPDSRWVAIVGPDGLTISSTVGSTRNIPLDTEGTIISPAWRPTLIR
jgi:Tol biopolymer transport system component